MKQNDINRSVWSLFESAKDTVTTQLVNAVAAGQLKIDRAALPVMVALVKDSIDQTFSKGFKSVEKAVEKALTAVTPVSASVKDITTRKRTKKN